MVSELEGGKHGYEVGQTAAAARRFIRKLGCRIGNADPVDLQLLLELRAELDAALLTAMRGQHAAGFSYAAIAEGMGTGRQAVYERLKAR